MESLGHCRTCRCQPPKSSYTKVCAVCGETFTCPENVSPNQFEKRKVCGAACAGKLIRKERTPTTYCEGRVETPLGFKVDPYDSTGTIGQCQVCHQWLSVLKNGTLAAHAATRYPWKVGDATTDTSDYLSELGRALKAMLLADKVPSQSIDNSRPVVI